MISSVIKPTIKYEENTTIDLLDKNNHFEVYEHILCGIDVELCIGNINNMNRIHNVLFCPVYLVKTNNSVIKIGIIEFTPIQMSYIFDENNEINLDNVQILLYSFVNPQYINEMTGNDKDEEETAKEEKVEEPLKLNIEPQQKSNTKSKPPPNNTDADISKNNKKTSLNITEVNEIKLNINDKSKKTRKNK